MFGKKIWKKNEKKKCWKKVLEGLKSCFTPAQLCFFFLAGLKTGPVRPFLRHWKARTSWLCDEELYFSSHIDIQINFKKYATFKIQDLYVPLKREADFCMCVKQNENDFSSYRGSEFTSIWRYINVTFFRR